MIPVQIFDENIFGIHSTEQDELESYFYLFSYLRMGHHDYHGVKERIIRNVRNTNCTRRGQETGWSIIYARTTSSETSHPSFGPVEQLLAQVSSMIPDNIQIFDENIFGIHSTEQDGLESYFYLFSYLRMGHHDYHGVKERIIRNVRNTNCTRRGQETGWSIIYARTTSSETSHPSFGPVEQLLAQVSSMIPDNIQIFDENIFGIHSTEQDGLESYFYLFSYLRMGHHGYHGTRLKKELSEMLGIPTVPEVARKQVGL